MITDAIISAFFGGVNALLSLLPSYTLPTGLTNDSGRIGQTVAQLNDVFPVSTVAQIIGLALSLKLIMIGADVTIWIYHQFWGSS